LEVVIDSNVFFRTLISGGDIINLFFDMRLKIFAPERLREEFIKNRGDILAKTRLSETEFQEMTSILLSIIHFVPIENYKEYLPKAKKLLGKHEKDEDFIALCLMKGIKLWTYEELLIRLGFGISTKEIAERIGRE